MTIYTEFKSNRQLSLEGWPTATIPYKKKFTQPCVSLQLTDNKTEKMYSIAIEKNALQKAGLSLAGWDLKQGNPPRLTEFIRNASMIEQLLIKAKPVVAKHLAPHHLNFFHQVPDANRAINRAINLGVFHQPSAKGAPGIYISPSDSTVDVFLNLKGNKLGAGSFSNVKKALWLTADEKPQIVAKKVFKHPHKAEYRAIFENEVAALKIFQNQRGIISIIDGGVFDDKLAIFLPEYDCNLDTFYTNSLELSIDEKLSAISQWLDGLREISIFGKHGDLSWNNLLLKKTGANNVEAVIADFGAFCFHGDEQHGWCTPEFAPPEYFAKEKVTSKQDVWGMGLCLFEMFISPWFPCFKMAREEIPKWTSTLKPGWALEYLPDDETPPFLLPLLSDMLHPDPACRPSAKEAFERFTVEWEAWRLLLNGKET